MSKMSEKVEYVKAQEQTRDHCCHWPGCTKQVKPALWGCRLHWGRLPRRLQLMIWQAYKPGQEVNGTPSKEYIKAAKLVQEWIKENG